MTDVQIAELLKTRKGRILFHIWYSIAFIYEFRFRIFLTMAIFAGIGIFWYLCEYHW